MFDLEFSRLMSRGAAAQRESTSLRAQAQELCAALARFIPLPGSSSGLSRSAPATMAVRTDAQGIVVEPNDAVARWLGVHASGLVGLRLLHFVARRDTRAFRTLVKGLGYPGAEGQAVVHFRPRRGKPVVVAVVVGRVGPNAFAWSLRLADAMASLN